MDEPLYAHTPNDRGEWQLLETHLRNVAKLAEVFASAFGHGELGRVAGLLHDVGKASKEFQDYLSACDKAKREGKPEPRSTVDHKAAGAVLAASLLEMLALPITGHHGGLADLPTVKSKLTDAKSRRDVSLAMDRMRELTESLAGSGRVPPEIARDPLACELLVRMLFSALVDADYLDTEAHWEQDRSELRRREYDLARLSTLLEQDQVRLQARSEDTLVNRARKEVYEACVAAAEAHQGVFRLTVPTGGGKTRSAMAFALKHAVKHRLERVIVAIPYTSIIDQNALVYRGILGADNVLEHHSAIGLDKGKEYSEQNLRRSLAAENWDAPVVVTTTVQLFDSLFSNKPGRCRKLHSLARSVIILDEVQTLPVTLVQPILDVLKELVANYGVTLVLSTATQPAFAGESPYLSGFETCKEIVPDPGRYFDALKRVEYRVQQEPWTWEQAVDQMRSRSQVMCVLNSRKDAVQLFKLLDDPDALHLSTLMCPMHRRDVLAEIRQRLNEGLPCRVAASQVVEAGVDLDFPCVMRAMGPLDRIVQAAGRCNREGLLSSGEVIVFTPADGRIPRGNYETEMADARLVLSEPGCDLHDPSVFERYFQMVWQDCNTDAHGICSLRSRLDFPEVADRFKMIPDVTVPVVVYYGDPGPGPIINEITRKGFVSRDGWRALAPYTTSIYSNDFRRYSQQGLITQLLDGLFVWPPGSYDSKLGLSENLPDPADLIT